MAHKKRRSGFTLVEIIVTLTILAILAAIIIPSMTGWIDKAIEKSAITEARACLTAMQSIAVERYAADGKYELGADEAETLALADSPAGADILEAEVNDTANVTLMVYKASNDVIVTYSGGAFTTSKEAHSFGSGDDMDKIMNAFLTNSNNGNIDSAAIGKGEKAIAVMKALQGTGIDLDALGAKSWAYRPKENKENGDGPFFYWTSEDISSKNVGDTVVVKRYNANTQNSKDPTYTVWQVKVKKNGNDVVIDNLVKFVSTTQDASEQTYEQMLKDYETEVNKLESSGS